MRGLNYRVFSLTWPASMQINWNKRNHLHEKRVELPEDWFGTPTWPPFHCFGTPIWPSCENTLYSLQRYISVYVGWFLSCFKVWRKAVHWKTIERFVLPAEMLLEEYLILKKGSLSVTVKMALFRKKFKKIRNLWQELKDYAEKC